MSELAYVLSHGDEAVTDAVVRTLERDGWRWSCAMVTPNRLSVGPVTGVVYIPGLLAESEGMHTRSRCGTDGFG